MRRNNLTGCVNDSKLVAVCHKFTEAFDALLSGGFFEHKVSNTITDSEDELWMMLKAEKLTQDFMGLNRQEIKRNERDHYAFISLDFCSSSALIM